QKALALVEAAPKDGLVFIACHHPLIEPHTKASAKTHRGAEALGALATAGADAVLTGHVHDAFDIAHEIDGATIRLIGAGTLSERTRADPPSFNEIHIEGGAFEVVCRKMTPQPDRVLPIETPTAP
ncbi:MAG: metallophosphoesterase, partial [Sphingomonas bacterium]|nr:metallophosphoesterase [Sphingomonas bacterium]